MARATIQIGAFTFDVSPEFAPKITMLRDRNGLRLGEREIWPVRGYLKTTGFDNAFVQFDALKLLLETEDVDVVFKKDGTPKRTLASADHERTPGFSGLSIAPSPGGWVTNVTYSFDIIAERWDSVTGVINNEFDTALSTQEDGREVQTKSGRVTTKLGSSAQAAAEASSPAVPSNFVLISESVTPDFDDTHASYTFVLRQRYKAFPAGVRWGFREVIQTKRGRTNTISGNAWFIGSQNTAQATKAAEDFMRELESEHDGSNSDFQLRFSDDTRRANITFSFDVADENSEDEGLLEFFRVISMSGGLESIVDWIIPGMDPLEFVGGRDTLRLVDAGFIRFRGEIPPFAPILTTSAFRRRTRSTSVEPERNQDPEAPQIYIRRWSHMYSSTDPDAGDNLTLEALLQGSDFGDGI